MVDEIFAGNTGKPGSHGAVEWAIAWTLGDGLSRPIATPSRHRKAATHETGLRAAILRGLKNYAELANNKRAAILTAEDVLNFCSAMLSVFVREPEFVGQTKDRLSSPEATRIGRQCPQGRLRPLARRLAEPGQQAARLGGGAGRRAAAAGARKGNRPAERDAQAAPPRQARRLPSRPRRAPKSHRRGGDSAGGSAKQARDRASQAVLPLRGKILNVAGASREKVGSSQAIADLIQALAAVPATATAKTICATTRSF